ncbi:S9 family peptidase, partial [bacterium]|nr:S9 family peptidase [bacterium]
MQRVMKKKRSMSAGKGFLILAAALLCMASPARAGGTLDSGLDTVGMNIFLESQAASVREEAHARIATREKLETQRAELHREFMFMLGLDPVPPRTPLEVNVVRTVDCDNYTIEVLYYQSLPGFYVTADLYRPKKGKAPFPATVWGPGHGGGIYGTKTGRQQAASEWAANGYICLVIDPVQAAEVYGLHHGLSCYDLRDWYSRGYTPMAIEVWNTMRAVDYLLSRKDVDDKKISLTGVSGGGHLSWMAGAAEERFAVVQPAAGTADVYTHISHDLQNMHCDCAYFPNIYRFDWPTLAGLIAPRPLLLHTSVDDAYYPPVGYKAVLERAQEIFGWYGKPGSVGMCEAPGPHGYYPEQREKAVEFSDRMLFGRNRKITSRPAKLVPDEELAALGGIYGKHPENI